VQALPSLQLPALGVWVHPAVGLHASSVQGLLSLQLSAEPAEHAPSWQTSPVVQGSPSLQASVFAVKVQPWSATQLSSVQGLPSTQLRAGPPTQSPSAQVSLVVHRSPSLQASVLKVCEQPPAGSQVWLVQGLLSVQSNAPAPVQLPPWQVSVGVQALPSSQVLALGVWVHPVVGLHVSSVQGLLSLQVSAVPLAHSPSEQVSPVVQGLPSLQGPSMATKAQPPVALQLSAVQGSPSTQFSAGPPTQFPASQVSAMVQRSPSLQGWVLKLSWQPSTGSHHSVVQGELSLQSRVPVPTQAPFRQVSVGVQALPSSQVPVVAACVHPVAGLHASSVQGLLSSQLNGLPAVHRPPSHRSPRVQGSPSEQVPAMASKVQPVAGLQPSWVQA